MNGYIHRCGKVLGGIKSIHLTRKCNINQLTLDPRTGTYTGMVLADPQEVAYCSFAEGAACYQEELQAENGRISVDHTLEFVTDKMDQESQNLLLELVNASYCGLVAIITTRNNTRWVIGYSEESRDERPLKLTRSNSSSGKRHIDSCGETVILRSYDTAKARIFSGSIL